MIRRRSRRRARRRKTRSRRRRLRFATLLFASLLAVIVAVELQRWPDVEDLARHDPETTAFIENHRRNGGVPAWEWVPYERISPHLGRAVLVAEDIDFFSHGGFATDEIRAALRQTFEEGRRLRGASTLSQQLAKNLWLSPSRSPLRKLREAILTLQLERHLEKRRILELYLNVAEFHPGVFGAEAAARRFYGISAASLSEDQAAALAASLPHSRWYPGSDSEAYRKHRERIRNRMDRATWIESLL